MIQGSSRRRRAAGRVVLTTLCVGWLLIAAAATALAADPSPSPGGDAGGDTRSPGEGPGLVGSPLFAIGGVLVVALASIGLAQAYLRATPDRSAARDVPSDEPGPD
jgi:hypothetical protein